MPDIKLKTRIQNKYKTLNEWNQTIPGDFVPLKGEVCYGVEDGFLYQKIGDGVTDFVDLSWLLNQADNEVNDETSPAYIKNRLAYPEYIEVPEEERTLNTDYFEGAELLDTAITPVAEIAALFGNLEELVLALFPDTKNVIIAQPYNEGILVQSAEDLTNDFNKLQLKVQGANDESQIWTFNLDESTRAISDVSVAGLKIFCFGNSNWGNLMANFLVGESAFESPIEFFPINTSLTEKYCVLFVGPVSEGEDGAAFMSFLIIDNDAYPPNEIIDGETTLYQYPFALELLARGQMHTIDERYLGDVRSDQNELDTSKRSYIKNRFGEYATIDVREDAAKTEWGYYKGTIKLASFAVIGAWGVKTETVTSQFPSNLEKALVTCRVKINGKSYDNCRIYKNAGALDLEDKDGLASSWYLGNPKYLTSYLNQVYAYFDEETIESAYVSNFEDNGLPFLIKFDFNSGTPLKTANWVTIEGCSDNSSVSIEIIPQKIMASVNPINSNYLETQSITGIYNEEHNSALFNSAYEASGTNSIAAGYGTKAIGSNSVAINNNTLAQAENSFALGSGTKTIGANSIAGGQDTIANDNHTVALGRGSWARGAGSVAMGDCISETSSILRVESQSVYVSNLDRTDYDFAQLTYTDENNSTRKTPWFRVNNSSVYIEDNGEYRIYLSTSDGNEQLSSYSSEFSSIELRAVNRTQLSSSFALGRGARANGQGSFALGDDTIASDHYQFTIGRCNEVTNGAFVIGNGSHSSYSTTPKRSNAMKVDWNGNATFAGEVSTTELNTSSIILTSPNGTKFKITVNDEGTLTSTKIY